jgi:hypothetical protein
LSAKITAQNKTSMSEFDGLAAELKKNSARGPKKEKTVVEMSED